MMIYIRSEGTRIKRWRIGIQWWHGPTIFWRTNNCIYTLSLPCTKGWGTTRWSADFSHFVAVTCAKYRISKKEITPQMVREEW